MKPWGPWCEVSLAAAPNPEALLARPQPLQDFASWGKTFKQIRDKQYEQHHPKGSVVKKFSNGLVMHKTAQTTTSGGPNKNTPKKGV